MYYVIWNGKIPKVRKMETQHLLMYQECHLDPMDLMGLSRWEELHQLEEQLGILKGEEA